MKKYIYVLVFVFTSIVHAQAPQAFNYQAIVRNNAGALLINQNVTLKFNILENDAATQPIYTETHEVFSDDLGQVNCTVGLGNVLTGSFSEINWENGTYYLSIEINTGQDFIAMGTTQLLSVPYALYSNSSGRVKGGGVAFNHYIGELFGGGIVVAVWKTNGVEHGLVTSLSDLGTEKWTLPAYYNNSTSDIVVTSNDGYANTNAIVNQAGPGTNYAAGLCDNYTAGGFSDWYLPSTWELNQCYTTASITNEVLGNTNGFKPKLYWSSTFYERYVINEVSYASIQDFIYGAVYFAELSSPNLVRAVRKY